MTTATAVVAWRTFVVEVRRTVRLSPTFLRVTFTGPDLGDFADNGFDQRIKVVLPLPGLGISHLDLGADWYAAWRDLPDERRNPIRTYTVRAVRAAAREVDVDFVLHGDTGPASSWATAAAPGDVVVLVGPNAVFDGPHGGLEFRASSAHVLLAGDETAAPAVLSILERMSLDARGHALLEVPEVRDALPVEAPVGVTVTWLARGAQPHGALLVSAVAEAARALGSVPSPGPEAIKEQLTAGPDDDILWEVPEADTETTPMSAWLAGEASVMRQLRRELRDGVGLDRSAVTCMGYWRAGRSEN